MTRPTIGGGPKKVLLSEDETSALRRGFGVPTITIQTG